MPTPEQEAICKADEKLLPLVEKIRSARSLAVKSVIARLLNNEISHAEAHDKIMSLFGDDQHDY